MSCIFPAVTAAGDGGCDDVGGAIAEDAPPQSPSVSWRHNYDRSSFMFQSSYIPDDLNGSGSTTGEDATADANNDQKHHDTLVSKPGGLVARGSSSNLYSSYSSSSGGSTPQKNNLHLDSTTENNFKQNRVVGFRDELSVHAEETTSNCGDDSTWHGFKIIVPSQSTKRSGRTTTSEQDCVHSRTGLSTITFESAFFSLFLFIGKLV